MSDLRKGDMDLKNQTSWPFYLLIAAIVTLVGVSFVSSCSRPPPLADTDPNHAASDITTTMKEVSTYVPVGGSSVNTTIGVEFTDQTAVLQWRVNDTVRGSIVIPQAQLRIVPVYATGQDGNRYLLFGVLAQTKEQIAEAVKVAEAAKETE